MAVKREEAIQMVTIRMQEEKNKKNKQKNKN